MERPDANDTARNPDACQGGTSERVGSDAGGSVPTVNCSAMSSIVEFGTGTGHTLSDGSGGLQADSNTYHCAVGSPVHSNSTVQGVASASVRDGFSARAVVFLPDYGNEDSKPIRYRLGRFHCTSAAGLGRVAQAA
jgi:hypothetical protein